MKHTDTPTRGAMKAAEIIMGDDAFIFTTYGRKSLDGLAALIDDLTGASELVEALRNVLNWADPERTSSAVVYAEAREVIAFCTGGAE